MVKYSSSPENVHYTFYSVVKFLTEQKSWVLYKEEKCCAVYFSLNTIHNTLNTIHYTLYSIPSSEIFDIAVKEGALLGTEGVFNTL